MSPSRIEVSPEEFLMAAQRVAAEDELVSQKITNSVLFARYTAIQEELAKARNGHADEEVPSAQDQDQGR
jgi:hypothetical protein